MKVLVVDDDVSFVTFVCTALDKLGVATEVAVTANDAGRRLANTAFRAVLLDLNLPDGPGLDVLRTMRQDGDFTPVVVLTGAGTVPAAVEAMKLGVVDFLEKPVRLMRLRELVESLPSPSPHQSIDRLASAVIAVVRSDGDVPTVREWGALVGRSESSLYALFELAGVPAKATLDLARLLRVNRCSRSGDQLQGLTSADPRTVERLLRRAGLTEAQVHGALASDLLVRQRLVGDTRLLRALQLLV